MVNRGFAFPFLAVAVFSGLAGCSPGKQNGQEASLRVALVATYVSDEAVEDFATYLRAGLPEYNDDSGTIEVIGISAGDSESDAMGFMAGSTRIATMLASKDIELWICDPETAARYADNGANYVALEELFSADELSSFSGMPVAVALTNDAGVTTGDFSESVGLDLSTKAAVTEATGIRDAQVFVLAGSTNRDAAKAAFRYLAH